ncbi:MAG: hypothetical protein WCO06_07300 [Candidatus Roizmanbacteria bacterium]
MIKKTYYTTILKKIIDFILGFCGIWILNGLLGFLLWQPQVLSGAIFQDVIIPVLVVDIFCCFIAILLKRKFISIGIVISLIVVLLLFLGSCAVLLSSLGRG